MSVVDTDLVSESSWFDSLAQPDRRWPVAVTFTETRIIFVEADTAAEAIEWAQDGADIGVMWEKGERTDWSDLTVDRHQHGPIESWRYEQEKAGPREVCPWCGSVARDADARALRYASHAGDCPSHIHHTSLTAAWPDAPGSSIVGWRASCSCDPPAVRVLPGAHDPRPYYPKDVAAAMARAHAADLPHSVNLPLGLPGKESC